MTEGEPFIDESRRPRIALDPNKKLFELTVEEVRELINLDDGGIPQPGTGKRHKDVTDKGWAEKNVLSEGGGGRLKVPGGVARKNNNKDQADKASADGKSLGPTSRSQLTSRALTVRPTPGRWVRAVTYCRSSEPCFERERPMRRRHHKPCIAGPRSCE